jgi:hypothetical protein
MRQSPIFEATGDVFEGPRMTVARVAAVAGIVLAAGACDFLGPDCPSGPGSLIATLVSPNGHEASAVFEVTGGAGLGEVSTDGGEVFFQHLEDSSRVVVVMDAPGEIEFLIETDDIGRFPDVEAIQVADGRNELRASLSGYEVRVSREKDSSKEGSGDQP